ncbi:MAG TPA: PBP1A family penicillin-binding protein, partial [Thermoanaerobaculia bacterium]|nr:PBP1A family penicillin-binding protein [Thermoanaerobaculia bacterium]
MERVRSRVRAWWKDLPNAPRRVLQAAGAAIGLILVAGIVFAWQVARDFPKPPYDEPSRLYGVPEQIAVGDQRSPAALAGDLADQGYREVYGEGPLRPGSFRRGEGSLTVRLRRFPTSDGTPGGGVPVAIAFKGSRVTGVEVAGHPTNKAELEPPLLATFYGPDVSERRAVRFDDLPERVVQAVLAAEDDAFYVHPGISVWGIGRAAWTNFREHDVRQGGSTITQQLVKNVYLGQERTLIRKLKEAVLAVLIEVRYSKRDILEAYLNEIYWGRSGSANVLGLGAAARAYFGKEAAALTLSEAATLAGMIRAPSDLSPVEHPAEAKARRDVVLGRLAELGWVEKARIDGALRAPLVTSPQPAVARGLAPYFADAMAVEARERFGIDDLTDGGYRLFSTLRWRDQKAAETAVDTTLAKLQKGERKRKVKGEKVSLQAALVSVDPASGAVLAYVGGRDYGVSQFDRVSQARRQAGSLVKPLIYAAAFEEGVATPATPLRDSPIVVKVGNRPWKPHNNDRAFHGTVTARAALSRSLNIPAVRVALQIGLTRVISQVREMGITGELEAVPAIALGAFETSPRELATAYATLASGGLRPPVHGLAVVLGPDGEPVRQGELPGPQRVVRPQPAYLVTSILQGSLDHGTAAAARRQGVEGRLAGKTGTTNGRRDSWFAGYSPNRVTVVWVGYDDNAPTRLSGSSAALPLWSRFTRATRPAGGWPDFEVPPGITTAQIDPASGQLATDSCP